MVMQILNYLVQVCHTDILYRSEYCVLYHKIGRHSDRFSVFFQSLPSDSVILDFSFVVFVSPCPRTVRRERKHVLNVQISNIQQPISNLPRYHWIMDTGYWIFTHFHISLSPLRSATEDKFIRANCFMGCSFRSNGWVYLCRKITGESKKRGKCAQTHASEPSPFGTNIDQGKCDVERVG